MLMDGLPVRDGLPKHRRGIDPGGVAKRRVVDGGNNTDQHHVSGIVQGAGERLIFIGGGRFGKEQVETDDAGAGLAEFLDQLRMTTAGPGPLLAYLRHGRFVNSHNDDMLRSG
jgi:hypothetical protein